MYYGEGIPIRNTTDINQQIVKDTWPTRSVSLNIGRMGFNKLYHKKIVNFIFPINFYL